MACGVCSEGKKALLVLLIEREPSPCDGLLENKGYGVHVTGNTHLNEMQEIYAVVFGPKAIFM